MNKKGSIGVVIACGNDEDVLKDALTSVSWADQITVVFSDGVIDQSPEIAKVFTKDIFYSQNNLGIQRRAGVSKLKTEWVLILDTDERVSKELQDELGKIAKNQNSKNGYLIPYLNHFWGKPVYQGNQTYVKMRFFKKNKEILETYKTHPEIHVTGSINTTKGKILHYSFRSLSQTLKKFTYYAREDVKRNNNLQSFTFPRLFLNPLHMWYTLFITEKGYRDGFPGLVLAFIFAYYELARYYLLWQKKT